MESLYCVGHNNWTSYVWIKLFLALILGNGTELCPHFPSFSYFQPVSEEFQNGEGFGYIVAFRANGTRGWKEKMVTSADSTTYKYRDETFPPLTPFEVKVGVYNNKGDGPFSDVVVIHSAEGGELTFFFLVA